MRTFSSILPFTNRFGLRRATCISGGGAIGGMGGEHLITPCSIWESCSFCTNPAPHQYPPSREDLVPGNCPRCGGEFEMRDIDITDQPVIFPTLGDRGRILLSGEIAQHNLRRHVDSSIIPYQIYLESADEFRLGNLKVPSREECMNLVLQGLVYLSDQFNSQQPLVTGDEGRWAFLMACSYSSGKNEVEPFIRGLEEKALVRLPSGAVGSVEIAEKGHERYKALVEAMRSSHQENQGG